MCDYFLRRMDGDQLAGDLTDVVRAGGAMPVGAADLASTTTEWQLPVESTILFRPSQSYSDGAGPSGDAFGDPFSGLPDHFSTDYPSSSGSAADFFDLQDAMDIGMAKVGFVDAAVGAGGGGGGGTVGAGRVLDMRRPIFPREMQMPGVSPRAAMAPYAVMGGDTVKLGVPLAGQAVGPCAFDAVGAGLQMASPRLGGIKRRFGTGR